MNNENDDDDVDLSDETFIQVMWSQVYSELSDRPVLMTMLISTCDCHFADHLNVVREHFSDIVRRGKILSYDAQVKSGAELGLGKNENYKPYQD